jgi:membrane protein implicated in regulation of membrane protease activity
MTTHFYWLALALVALIAEFFSGAFYLLVAAIALAGMALAAWLQSDTLTQALIGSIIAVLGFVLVWRYHHRQSAPDRQLDDPDLGQTVKVLHVVDKGAGRVLYRGTEWDAELLDVHLQAGSRGIIVGRDGNRLKISR